jgi:hypothetical protein
MQPPQRNMNGQATRHIEDVMSSIEDPWYSLPSVNFIFHLPVNSCFGNPSYKNY